MYLYVHFYPFCLFIWFFITLFITSLKLFHWLILYSPRLPSSGPPYRASHPALSRVALCPSRAETHGLLLDGHSRHNTLLVVLHVGWAAEAIIVFIYYYFFYLYYLFIIYCLLFIIYYILLLSLLVLSFLPFFSPNLLITVNYCHCCVINADITILLIAFLVFYEFHSRRSPSRRAVGLSSDLTRLKARGGISALVTRHSALGTIGIGVCRMGRAKSAHNSILGLLPPSLSDTVTLAGKFIDTLFYCSQ